MKRVLRVSPSSLARMSISMRAMTRSTRRRTASLSTQVNVFGFGGKGHQLVGQSKSRIHAPGTERTGQALPVDPLAQACTRDLPGNLCIEDVLARLVEFRHRAGFAELLCQLGDGLRRGLGVDEELDRLVGCHRAVVGAHRFGRDAERGFHRANLRLPKARLGNFTAPRQREQRQHVLHDLPLDLEAAGPDQAREFKPSAPAAGWLPPSAPRKCQARCRRPAAPDC